MRDLYKQIEVPSGMTLEACPVCGTEPGLWQYSEDKDKPTTKVVMCLNGEAVGPQIKDDGTLFAGCILYMPCDDFYRGRIVEAVNYWNEYSKAMVALQRKNRWKRARVLRSNTQADAPTIGGRGRAQR